MSCLRLLRVSSFTPISLSKSSRVSMFGIFLHFWQTRTLAEYSVIFPPQSQHSDITLTHITKHQWNQIYVMITEKRIIWKMFPLWTSESLTLDHYSWTLLEILNSFTCTKRCTDYEAHEALLDCWLLAIAISCFRLSWHHLQLRNGFSSVVFHVYSLGYWICSAFISSKREWILGLILSQNI